MTPAAAGRDPPDRCRVPASSRQASLAESQANLALARKAVDDSFTRVSESSLLNVPGLRPLRRDLLQSALAFYEEFLRRGGDGPGILADLAATQCASRAGLLRPGREGEGAPALRRAAELYDKTLTARPDEVALLERQSEVWHRLGDLDYRTDKRPANAAYRKAIAIRERLAAAHPAEPRFRMALSRSLNGLALTTVPVAEVRDAYRRSLELRLELADEIPEDADLLHGLGESFINMGNVLWSDGHRDAAVELTTHAIDYGRAARGTPAARPGIRVGPGEQLTAMSPLTAGSSGAATRPWRCRPRASPSCASSRPTIPRSPPTGASWAMRLSPHCRYLEELGRTNEAVSSYRQAAEIQETKSDPDADTLMAATFFRGRVAVLLAGKAVERGYLSWPESARHEVDRAVADLEAAVARGYRRADLVRRNAFFKLLLTRDDMKALLAEMERPPARSAPGKAEIPSAAASTPSPLDRPDRLEEDRILGELTIGLLAEDAGAPDRAAHGWKRCWTGSKARRKSGPDSPGLEPFVQSIRLRLGEQLWQDGKLAEARRLWDDVLAPVRRRPADDRGDRPS